LYLFFANNKTENQSFEDRGGEGLEAKLGKQNTQAT